MMASTTPTTRRVKRSDLVQIAVTPRGDWVVVCIACRRIVGAEHAADCPAVTP